EGFEQLAAHPEVHRSWQVQSLLRRQNSLERMVYLPPPELQLYKPGSLRSQQLQPLIPYKISILRPKGLSKPHSNLTFCEKY
ncbi:hypothetical protein L0F63_001501, partial [Massospora cicadina]